MVLVIAICHNKLLILALMALGKEPTENAYMSVFILEN